MSCLSRRTSQNFVVRNMRLQFEEKFLILRIVDGLFVLRPGEGSQGVVRIPQRDERKLRRVLVHTPQHPDAPIAFNGTVIRYASFVEVVKIPVFIRRFGYAAPYASNHGSASAYRT